MKPRKAAPDLCRLRAALSYEPETGVFTWRVRVSQQMRAGDRAGCVRDDAYRWIAFEGRQYKAAQLAWLLHHGVWMPGIDHRNRVRCEDAIDNLREATAKQQRGNTGRQRNNTSGVKGVHRNGNSWRARIKIDGRPISLGSFPTIEAAAEAYAGAARKHFGEFANPARSDE